MRAGTLLVDRYRVGRRVGYGSFGQVFRAVDTQRDRPVAIKWLNPEVDNVRQETAALRAFSIRGVLDLLDEGIFAGRPFLVTQWIDGEAFPGGGWASLEWEALRPLAIDLLRIVAYIHAHQTLHLDLKPNNILVDADDAVHVVDFGLAAGNAIGAARSGLHATNPRFVAPEVLAGAAPDERADIFALGRLLHDSLLDPAPPAVRALFEQMHAPDPAARPRSVRAVLDRLGAPRPLAPRLRRGAPVRPADLRALFESPLPFARERVVDWLLRKARGDAATIEAILAQWVAQGVARLGPGGRLIAPRRWRDEIAPDAVLREVREALIAGRTGDIRRWVRQALLTSHPEEAALIRLGALAALDTFATEHVEEAQYWLNRSAFAQPALADLLEAARLKDSDTASHRSLAALDLLSPTNDPDLLAHAAALRFRLVDPPEDATDEGMIPPVLRDHTETRSRLLEWRGRRAYQRGQYQRAVALHAEAAHHAVAACRVLSARLNGAAAQLETGDFAETARLADTCIRSARTVRHDFYYLRATWLWREASWRAGRLFRPDTHLVEQAMALGPAWQAGLIALTEACGAWRTGHQLDARRLGTLAAEAFRRDGRSGRALALADAIVASTRPDRAPLDALAKAEMQRGEDRGDDIGWQILGVVASVPAGRRWSALARRRAAHVHERGRRRELFTPDEIRAGLRAPFRWPGVVHAPAETPPPHRLSERSP